MRVTGFQTRTLPFVAAFTAGLLVPGGARAAPQASFNTIAENIIDSISELPGLLTGLAYMLGLLLGILGILKIKDHVDNPQSAPLKDGMIRLAVGGALFSLSIVFEAMKDLIMGDASITAFGPAILRQIDFAVDS